MVTVAGAVLWSLVLQAQAPALVLPTAAAPLTWAPAALAADSPPPGTLLHPVHLQLDRAEPGWQVERLEVRLDGTLLAERGGDHKGRTALEETWTGEVSDGDHVLSAVLLLRSTTEHDADGQPRQLRMERAQRFRAGPSQALALLIQSPAGGNDQSPRIVLSGHGR